MSLLRRACATMPPDASCGPGSSERVLLAVSGNLSRGHLRGSGAGLTASGSRNGALGLAAGISRQGRMGATESKEKSVETQGNKPTIRTGSESSCSE